MIIKLTNREFGGLLLNTDQIVSVTPAGASGAWHGTRSYVRTTDGKTHDVEETVDQIYQKMEELK